MRFGRAVALAYVAAALLFVYAPVLVLVLFSLNTARYPAFPIRGLTLHWYREFLADGELLRALANSLMVGAASAAAATALGFVSAWWGARGRSAGSRLFEGLQLLALTIPYLLMALGLLSFLRYLGFGRSLVMVWVGHTTVTLPVAYLVIRSQLTGHQVELERAARDLGASTFQAWRFVTVPLLGPAVMAAFLLSFTFSWDEFLIAWFVAGFDVTFPVKIWEMLRSGLSPKLNAAGTLVLAVSMTLVWTGIWSLSKKAGSPGGGT